MSKQTSTTAVIAADTHFKLVPDEAGARRLLRFQEFLRDARRVDHLILLGDIFDFWFDYPHFRLKGYEDLLITLDEVRDAGVRIHFIGGNHDIWAADYFRDRYGCSGDTGPLDLELGGLRLRLDHGDGLLAKDYIYKTFRRIVRHKAGIVFAKSLHPELLYAFSRWLSGVSRQAYREEGERLEALAAAYLDRASGPWDTLVIGHVHHAMDIEAADRRLLGLGSWLGEESYALLQDGRLTLKDYRNGFPEPDGRIPDPETVGDPAV